MAQFGGPLIAIVGVVALVAIVEFGRGPYRKAKARYQHRRYEREVAGPVAEPITAPRRRRRRRVRHRVMRTGWKVTHPVRALRHWWYRRPLRHERRRSARHQSGASG